MVSVDVKHHVYVLFWMLTDVVRGRMDVSGQGQNGCWLMWSGAEWMLIDVVRGRMDVD